MTVDYDAHVKARGGDIGKEKKNRNGEAGREMIAAAAAAAAVLIETLKSA